jgi:fused signal recognition particle receptor
MGLFDSIRKGLTKTREAFVEEVNSIVGVGKLTEEMLENLEEQLIRSDIGVEPAFMMVDALRDRALGKSLSTQKILDMMREVASEMLLEPQEIPWQEGRPHVILVIGVNGAGKTTTIGKLANRYKQDGKKVILAAGDTFRAAAVEQLEAWAKRADVNLVKHHEGADSAAVAYDAYESALSKGADVLIIDTAGRLHNKSHLMDELSKVVRILQKHDSSLPHECLLVIDGNTGQNTINQVKTFNQDIALNGLVVTKLDGTAKGGSVLSISRELKVPIQWLGLGEKIEDLIPFSKKEFLNGLFKENILEETKNA